jgi:hypothetical protein
MTNFPALVPTSRSVTQGQYPVKRFTSIAGTGTTRAYGSQPFGASLEVEFGNVPDLQALAVVTCYESARGSYASLSLPITIWDGMDDLLREQLERDYTWRFSEQPRITSVRPGISSVTVRLEGMRDG